MADRVFIFHETTDNFRAFEFDGSAETSDNWDPSLTTVRGAAANATHIYVLDTSTNPAIVRAFLIDETRQSNLDITMQRTGSYDGIALTDSHLVAVKDGTLEYYDLSTRVYDATMDVTLPSRTSPEYYSGICRSGNFLYLVTHNDSTYQPRIYKRNLDGSAVSDWAGQASSTALTIFATNDHVITVRKNGGHWDRWSFDGTQASTLNTIGTGVWAASYTTHVLPSITPVASPLNIAIETEYCLTVTITGSPTKVTVEGTLEGFSYTWDKVDTLKIMGTPKRLLSNEVWTIKATYADGTVLTEDVIFNVIASAPIITTPERSKLYKGLKNEVFVPIANYPNIINAKGLLVGLTHERQRRTDAEGVLIKGEVPKTAEFSVTEGAFDLYAANSGGNHSMAAPFDILDPPTFYGSWNPSTDTFYEFEIDGEANDIAADRSFTMNRHHEGYIVVDDDYIYSSAKSGTYYRYYRVPRNTANGTRVSATEIGFDNRGTNYHAVGIAVDGDDFYYAGIRESTTVTTDRIQIRHKDTWAFVRTFDIPNRYELNGTNVFLEPRGIVLDGDDLIFVSRQAHALFWVSKNTGNNDTATITKAVPLSADIQTPHDMAVVGEHLLISDTGKRKLHLVNSGTGNIIWTYNFSSSLNRTQGIAIL